MGLPCAATANSFNCLAGDGTLYIAAGAGVSTVNNNEDDRGSGQIRLSVPFVYADDQYFPVVRRGHQVQHQGAPGPSGSDCGGRF